MGETFSRTLQACCNPEGTAAIVRKKKAQRNTLNKYEGLLSQFDEALGASSVDMIQSSMQELRRNITGDVHCNGMRATDRLRGGSGCHTSRNRITCLIPFDFQGNLTGHFNGIDLGASRCDSCIDCGPHCVG